MLNTKLARFLTVAFAFLVALIGTYDATCADLSKLQGPATVVRSNGFVIQGVLISIKSDKVNIRAAGRHMTLRLRDVKKLQIAGEVYTYIPDEKTLKSSAELAKEAWQEQLRKQEEARQEKLRKEEDLRRRSQASPLKVRNETEHDIKLEFNYYIDLDGNRRTPRGTWSIKAGKSSHPTYEGDRIGAAEVSVKLRTKYGEKRWKWEIEDGKPLTVVVKDKHVASRYTGPVRILNDTNQTVTVHLDYWVDGNGEKHMSDASWIFQPGRDSPLQDHGKDLIVSKVSIVVKNSYGKKTWTWTKRDSSGRLTCRLDPESLHQPPGGSYKKCSVCNGKGSTSGKCYLCDGDGRVDCDNTARFGGLFIKSTYDCVGGYFHNVWEQDPLDPEKVIYKNIPCRKCNTTGFLKCYRCNGKGRGTFSCTACNSKGKVHVFAR